MKEEAPRLFEVFTSWEIAFRSQSSRTETKKKNLPFYVQSFLLSFTPLTKRLCLLLHSFAVRFIGVIK